MRLENRTAALLEGYVKTTTVPNTVDSEWGLFRVVEVEEAEAEAKEDGVGGVTVVVDTRPRVPPLTGRPNADQRAAPKALSAHLDRQFVSSPCVALHAVHSCDITPPASSSSGVARLEESEYRGAVTCDTRLLAYGGAAGLVRLHVIRHVDVHVRLND